MRIGANSNVTAVENRLFEIANNKPQQNYRMEDLPTYVKSDPDQAELPQGMTGKKAALLKRIDTFTVESNINEKLVISPEQ